MRFLSLFSGIGGVDLGLERAGHECVGQVEIDPFCQRVLAARWPGVERAADVRGTVYPERAGSTGTDQPTSEGAERTHGQGRFGPVDLLVGGFPCQDLSVAGKRAGIGGERSGLFWEIVRIAKILTPTWGIFEQVPGLVSSHRGRDMETVLAGLRECWPAVGYRILDSQHFGVPQRRRRVFFVCGPTEDGVAQVLALTEGGGGDSPAGGDAGAGFTGGLTSGIEQSGRIYDAGGVAPMFRHGTGGMTGPMVSILAVDTTQVTSAKNYSNPRPGDPCHPLAEGAHPPLLIGGMNASTSETDAGALLLRVRQAVGAQAFTERGSRVLDSLQPPEVLRPLLHGEELRRAAGEVRRFMDDGTLPREEDRASWAMFALWQGECLRRASPEWRLAGQLAVELGAHLSRMPSTGTLGRAQDQSIVRRLTPLEAERLQGFPDGWTCGCQPLTAYAADPDAAALACTCPDSPRYRALGNAVTVNVIEWLGRRLIHAR